MVFVFSIKTQNVFSKRDTTKFLNLHLKLRIEKKFNVIFTNLSILPDATEKSTTHKMTMCAYSPSSSALTLTQEQIDLLGVKKQILVCGKGFFRAASYVSLY